MNVNQQLVKEIEKLGKNSNLKKLLTDREEKIWEFRPEYEYLKELYLNSRFRKYKKRLKFSQLVRQILDPRKDERKYMDSRLHTLLRHYGNTDHYFDNPIGSTMIVDESRVKQLVCYMNTFSLFNPD